MARKREIDADTLEKAESLYRAYPRKVGKGAAIKAILRALEKVPFYVLLEAVTAYEKCTKRQDKRFVPHPATWFNQERWADDRAEWEPQTLSLRNMRDVDSVLEIARSQMATADEAWRIVKQVADRMETVTAERGGQRCADTPDNRELAGAVPEPAKSVAMSIRWTNIRFGDEAAVRKEFCILYERRLRAEVNRTVAPMLMGAAGIPGVERRRIEG